MKTKKIFFSIIMLIILIMSSSFYYFDINIKDIITPEKLKIYILSVGIWGPLIIILICIIISVTAIIPSFLITFTATAIYGWWIAAILTWIGFTIGSAINFTIAKFLGREFVEKHSGRGALNKLDNFIGQEGIKSILIARLLPFIPYNLTSYFAGITSINFSSFMIGTMIGQTPGTILYSGIGVFFTKDIKFAVIGISIFIALIVLIAMLKKKFYKTKTD